jgi:hypothetical protein
MAAPTNTFTSTAAIGNREDLSDIIYNIAPTETPFLSLAAKAKATATLHEWQTQALAAPADNAQAEGDDATADAAIPTERLGNRTQISSKTASVSGTQETVDKAGRKSEMAYQMSLKSAELKLAMEFGLTQNNVAAAGATRRSRGLVGYMGDNVNAGVGYVAPNYRAGNTPQTDGTLRQFTEDMLLDVSQKCWTSGGNPDVIMMGGVAKGRFSKFLGNATRMDKAEDQKVYSSTDIYVTDFHTLKAVPNRVQRPRDVFLLETAKVAVAYLRPFQKNPLAKTGDSERMQILAEYCLENRAPNAHGGVLDVN